MLTADGRVFRFGDAHALGDAHSAIASVPNDAAVHLEPTASGNGYWIVDRFGHVQAFGDARGYGSLGAKDLRVFEAVRTLRRTPSGKGYWIVTTFGRVFARGDAHLYGDASKLKLAAVIVDAMSTPTGHGYWLVGADGGIFGYGDAR